MMATSDDVIDAVGKLFWVAAFVSIAVIRKPFAKNKKQNIIESSIFDVREKLLLVGIQVTFRILPFMYIVLPNVFAKFNYPKKSWLLVAAGAVTSTMGLYLFERSHRDLDRNWSGMLQIRKNHSLVTTGIYEKIRHPMYTSICLLCVGQAMLLQNYIAGMSAIVYFWIVYVLRVSREEAMMQDKFGSDYQEYCKRTGRMTPWF